MAVQVEIWTDINCPFCYLGKARFEDALADFEHRDEVQVVHRSFELDPEREAARLGANGVPFFVFDRTYGVSGAQPPEVFTQTLERAWRDHEPALEVIGSADACGPDGCALPERD